MIISASAVLISLISIIVVCNNADSRCAVDGM